MKQLFFTLRLFLGICLLLQKGALFAQIVNIEESRITGTNDSTWWYGYLKGSAVATKIAESSLQLNAEARVEYKRDPHMVLWLLNGTLLRAGQQDFTRQLFGHMRYNYKLNAVWTAEAFVQVQTNPLLLLQNRSLAGLGIRWRPYKSADGRHRIYLGASGMLENNIFSAPYGERLRNRFSSYVSVTFRPGKQWALYGTTYWQPAWGLIKVYRFSSDWTLHFKLGKHLSFTTEYTYNIDKDLPVPAAASTYLWRNGLLWNF